jgi:uncharacterized RDD family membrane protein YckC
MFAPLSPGLPDPDAAPGFYDGVPLKRLLAWLVDAVIVLGLTLLAVPLTAFVAAFFFPVVWLAIGFVYRAATLAAASATPGMRLVGIELRDRWGRPFDAGHAILHTLGYTLSISTLVVQAASIALMLTSARRQGLTDLVLGTAAINRPAESI